MTCRQLKPYLVDFARGAVDAAGVEEQVTRHVRGCENCRALLERERILSAALQRVAGDIVVPGATGERERALLAAFDAARSSRTRGAAAFRPWSAAVAAALVVAAVGGWRLARIDRAVTREVTRPPASAAGPRARETAHTPLLPSAPAATAGEERRWPGRRPVPRRPSRPRATDVVDASFEATTFMAWPGAAAGPPLESGSVIRVSLPVSILPALGLWPPPSAGSDVPADVLVGQDGFARAIRLVPD